MNQAAVRWSTFFVVLAGIASAWADPVSGHALHAVALALCCCAFVAATPGKPHPALLLFITIAALGAAQLLFSATENRYETLGAAIAWLARGAIFYLAFVTLRKAEARGRVLTALLVAGTALSFVGIVQWFTSNGRVFWLIATPYQDEVLGTFLNRDQHAVFVELLFPIALGRALTGRSHRILYLGSAALLYATVVASGARAGTVLIAVEALVLLTLALTRKSARPAVVAATALGIAAFSLAAGWQYVLFRFGLNDLFAFRRQLAQATIHMISDRPWRGFGLGAWPTVYPAFAVFDPPGFFMNHAHNDWLEWAAEGGLPVLAPLLLLFGLALSFARRELWTLGLAVSLLHAAVDFPMQKACLAVLFAFLFGAAAAACQSETPLMPKAV